MPNVVVLGMQWGDEGKGKIVDLICPAFDAVVRYQGGHNAGHTVKFADRHFALHFLPSGIVHEGVDCVLGNGMVIAPDAFFAELEKTTAVGVDCTGRLWLSNRAQVLLPPHAALDQARETASGAGKIGTTARGIGPAYESKASRWGLRVADLGASDLEQRLERLGVLLTPQLRQLGTEPPQTVTELAALCRGWAERLAPMLADTAQLLNRWIAEGRGLLFEGAQGALLDIDHGTYPFVTSSNTTAGGVATGTGVPPTRLDGVLGVVKAYSTRVGGGPFATELLETTGEHLRRRGNEFGTTTGRPRRCGWFDAVAVRYACMLSGVSALALTKLDVLDELDEIKVCTAYRYRGKLLDTIPAELEALGELEPVYRTVPGWRASTIGVLDAAALPEAAQAYVELLEKEVGAPAVMISTGPRREETILRDHPELGRLLGARCAEVVRFRNGL